MINLLFLLGDVLKKGFIGIILTLDTLIYGLISSAFKVFMAIASARLLSSDAYYAIANKIYLIIYLCNQRADCLRFENLTVFSTYQLFQITL